MTHSTRSLQTVLQLHVAMMMLLLLLQPPLASSASSSSCQMHDDTCVFHLEVTHMLTMMFGRVAVYAENGKLYRYDVTNTSQATPIDPDKVIIADGWEMQRLVIATDGTMPGPPIEVYENQTVIVHVKNSMTSASLSVHWHGLHQTGTPWMDGVAFVTQCPIEPGQTFTYKFKAEARGTFWYHSHSGAQLGMGLVGAFIIRERKPQQIPEHIMMLQDWNHDWDSDVAHMRMEYGSFRDRQKLPTTDSLDGAHFSNFYFESGLINGRGRYFFPNGSSTQSPLTVFQVSGGQEYRFRVIGAGVLYPFRVSVDAHVLKVIASDGFEIEPVVAESFVINPGERFDFLLLANQAVDNYWVRAQTLEVNVDNHIALAVLRYDGALERDPVTSKKNCTPRDCDRCLVVNCPFTYYPEEAHTDCLRFNQLRALEAQDTPGAATPEADDIRDIFLNFAFPGVYSFPGSVNGMKFKLPPVPALTQPSEISTKCQPGECGELKHCHCTSSIDLQANKVYQMVFLNLGNGKGWGHPIHMHGHSYHVVKMGFPSYNETTAKILADNPDVNCRGGPDPSKSYCNNATWADSSWGGNNIPGLDLSKPPRKDTIIIPTGGYAVIRIRADNPGVWFMHCHIELHSLDGMAIMINESFPEVPKPPRGFPKCGDFRYDLDESEPAEKQEEAQRQGPSGGVGETLVASSTIALVSLVLFLVAIIYRKKLEDSCGQRVASGRNGKEVVCHRDSVKACSVTFSQVDEPNSFIWYKSTHRKYLHD